MGPEYKHIPEFYSVCLRSPERRTNSSQSLFSLTSFFQSKHKHTHTLTGQHACMHGLVHTHTQFKVHALVWCCFSATTNSFIPTVRYLWIAGSCKSKIASHSTIVREWHLSVSLYKLKASMTCTITELRATPTCLCSIKYRMICTMVVCTFSTSDLQSTAL